MANEAKSAAKYKAVITDIEGTTTPISFVKDILFPFARAHVASFLEKSWDQPSVQAHVKALAEFAQQEKGVEAESLVTLSQEPDAAPSELRTAVVAFVHFLIDHDRKVTPLKALQGDIWLSGYQSGELQGQVFDDVVPALKSWAEKNCQLYVYSSGSIAAQKLLFGYSNQGDLLPMFSGHFDLTTAGDKKEASSYQKIAKNLDVSLSDCLFLTDLHAEAVAATEAGMDVVLLLRQGNATLPPKHSFATAADFSAIQI